MEGAATATVLISGGKSPAKHFSRVSEPADNFPVISFFLSEGRGPDAGDAAAANAASKTASTVKQRFFMILFFSGRYAGGALHDAGPSVEIQHRSSYTIPRPGGKIQPDRGTNTFFPGEIFIFRAVSDKDRWFRGEGENFFST